MTNNSKASIREVYEISQRLEEKIDALDSRLSSIEGKVSVISILWSSIVSVGGIIIGKFFLKE